MTAGTAPPVTQTQEPPLAPPFAAPFRCAASTTCDGWRPGPWPRR